MESLQSDIKSVLKLLRKIRATQEDPSGEKAKARATNNGFNRAQEIDEKLREFLGLPVGESISRSEVTRRITTYISENGLKHPDNGRMIILDNKLIDLLQPPADVQVTFLNIQKYLSPHYIKVEKEVKPKRITKKQQAELDAAAAAPVPVVEEVLVVAEAPKKKVVRKPKPVSEVTM